MNNICFRKMMKRQGGLFVRDGRTGKEGGVEGHHTSVLPSDRPTVV